MTFIRLLIAAALLGDAAQVSGQEDPAAAPKTGSIAGVAIDEKSGEGIAKALIILRRDQEGGLGEITDAKGKFTLRDVDPGVYTLSIERDGYVAAGEKSQTVSVQAGQTTSDLKLKLQRTGTVSGRILDADGDPISGVGVVILPARAIKNARPVSFFAATNDRGEYRVFHIPPAGYRVSATYTPTGRYDGVRMQRPAGADAASGSEAYPIVYYPATTDARQATVLTVEPGTEIHGIDLQLVRVRGVRVRGRVTATASSGPAPLFQMVTLVPIGQRDAPAPGHDVLIRDPKGEFEFTGVMPGTYRLQVETAGFNEPNSNRMSARRTLEVGVSDLEGIEMTPGRPASLSGRVIAPEDRKLTPGLIVMLGPRDAGDTQGGGMAQVGADGAFTMSQVAPGEYDVLLGVTSGEGDDTYIHAIRHGDTDALVEGLRVGEGPLAPLEIVLKANGGAAECSVNNDKGEPVPNASIMVVPDPPKQRQLALFGECRTQADGTCKITGITPGEYHVYAFPAGGEVDRRDPDAFKPFEKYGEAMKFAEGERKPVNLKTAPIE